MPNLDGIRIAPLAWTSAPIAHRTVSDMCGATFVFATPDSTLGHSIGTAQRKPPS